MADVTVTISDQSAAMLEKLATFGVYGVSVSEVAARFIDHALQESFVTQPMFDAAAVARRLSEEANEK